MAQFLVTKMFTALIVIVAINLSNCDGAQKAWWETGNFYQIYPRSFMDSNNDGIGDLNGVTQRLPYLKDLGIDGAWLSPIFKSPQVDFGYDASDYTQIHYEYGTVDDLERLIEKAKDLGIKIILDFVPNHTSDEHEWFIKSVEGDPEYKDFYVWQDGKLDANGTRIPPTNWKASFRYSAWEWNEKRQQYYLHQFHVRQPDLNYRNPAVNEKMKDILRYWLNKGIAGFRVDAVPFLFEKINDDGSFNDEPLSGKCTDVEAWCYMEHTETQDQPGSYDLVYSWRAVLDEYTKEKGDYARVMMTEAYTTLNHIMEFYGNSEHNGSHIPFNFEMILDLNDRSTAVDFKKHIDTYLNNVPEGKVPNWVLGNHDNKRIQRRLGESRIDLINILLQTLPGVAITYYGEEIGMKDVYIPWSRTIDPQACNTDPNTFDLVSRDTARTPMQWDDSKNSGFSSASATWLPIASDYKQNNVKVQLNASKSHLKVFKKLTQLRKEQILQYGDFSQELYNDDVYVYKRQSGNESLVIVLNFGNQANSVDVTKVFDNVPANLTVATASIESDYNDGDHVNSSNVELPANVGVVLYGNKK